MQRPSCFSVAIKQASNNLVLVTPNYRIYSRTDAPNDGNGFDGAPPGRFKPKGTSSGDTNVIPASVASRSRELRRPPDPRDLALPPPLLPRDDLREAFRVRLPLRPSSGNRCLKLPDFRNWGVRCCVD